MTDAQAVMLGVVLAPLVVVGAIGMIRGYHLHLKVWKGDPKEDLHDHHHDR